MIVFEEDGMVKIEVDNKAGKTVMGILVNSELVVILGWFSDPGPKGDQNTGTEFPEQELGDVATSSSRALLLSLVPVVQWEKRGGG